MKKAIIGLLVSATVALAFIQIDDTHTQTILAGIKTFIPEIHFQATGGGTEYVGLVAPAVVNTPSVTYKLPANDGTSGQAIVTDGSANLSFATVGGSTPLPTPTPLAFGTPGVIAVFNSTELGSYPGAACTPPAFPNAQGPDGAWTCATPLPATVPTDTPLIDLLYSGKLNLGANASGTPLGLVPITANATPAPHDRIIYCNSSLATPTPVIYTMPPATGTGRIIDMINVGTGYCEMNAGSDFMNDGHTEVFIQKWQADTCYDVPSTTGQWACRNLPAPTPT